MYKEKNNTSFISRFRRKPDAAAEMKGGSKYPDISGEVYFYQKKDGVLVSVKIYGLPNEAGKCKNRVFGFHIHSGNSCSGNKDDEFADALSHYNPDDCRHPEHAGDLPPLFGNDGNAEMSFMTNRFNIQEIIGKTVIIHSMPDDFTSQPSGNSGEKIACGIIKSTR